jgi:hypothetical protein
MASAESSQRLYRSSLRREISTEIVFKIFFSCFPTDPTSRCDVDHAGRMVFVMWRRQEGGRGRKEEGGRGRKEEGGRGRKEEGGRGRKEEGGRGRKEEGGRGRRDEVMRWWRLWLGARSCSPSACLLSLAQPRLLPSRSSPSLQCLFPRASFSLAAAA